MTVRLVPGDPHDDELVARVHPAGWRNPDPASRYDLVVIGAGTAGLVSAAGAAALGARVALVERALMGGDCLNTGCVPSKALLRAAAAVHAPTVAARLGLPAGTAPDGREAFSSAMERLRRLRAELARNDSAERFRSLGVDVFLGNARFVSGDAVDVDGARLRFSRAVIAVGARAAVPDAPGLAEAGFLTNESVFALTELPRRLAVVGAGPIGCELAQAFRRFGSEVTVVSDGARPMPRDDADAAAVVEKRLREEGVAFRFGARVHHVERAGCERRLVFEDGERVVADEILVATGRAPNVEDLGLDAAGVEVDREGVHVDDRLRTTNARIFAAGDCCSTFKFTHAADAMARVVLRNALFRLRAQASALVIPWCTYTDPEVAHVGVTLEQARQRGDVDTFTAPLADVDRAVLDGETDGFARLHVARRGGRLLGATLVSAHAGESISAATLAIGRRLRVQDFESVVHPYPTQAEALRRAAAASQRARLTPAAKRVLGWWRRALR